MNIVGTTLFSTAAYYISSKVPADLEKNCSDYALALMGKRIAAEEKAQGNTYNPLQEAHDTTIIERAYFWVKSPSQTCLVARVIGLVFHAASMALLVTPPVAVGLTLLKSCEVILFQINDSRNSLDDISHGISSTYTAAKVLRFVNRIINILALGMYALPGLAEKNMGLYLMTGLFCSFEAVIASVTLYASGVLNKMKRAALFREEFYIPECAAFLTRF